MPFAALVVVLAAGAGIERRAIGLGPLMGVYSRKSVSKWSIDTAGREAEKVTRCVYHGGSNEGWSRSREDLSLLHYFLEA
jgi:hypothetical protein